MQANPTSPHPRFSDIASWLAAVFGLLLLVLLILSFALENRAPASTPATSLSNSGSIAYFEFGSSIDTLWLASSDNSQDRQAIFSAPHARDFGVVPSISPQGVAVAYAALPPSTAAPGPDSPADLWYATINSVAEPRIIASDIDLLVAPVWTPDAERVVFRRSDATGYSLVEIAVDGGSERVLVTSSIAKALFPVGFTPDGATLYHVGLGQDGSRLFALERATGVVTPVANLSDGLTRDWALAPDGSQLAFLALTSTADALTSRAFVFDFESNGVVPVTDENASAFGPVWDNTGALVVGSLTRGGEGSLIRIEDGKASQVLGSATGFDVPLAFSPGGGFLVRAFEGASTSAPGLASLTFIDSSGERHVLSSHDATLVGWSAR